MFSLLKRFFTDEETFLLWYHRVVLTFKSLLLTIPVAMSTGAITWPEWVPPKLLTAMVMLSAFIQFGEKNRTVEEVKKIAIQGVEEKATLPIFGNVGQVVRDLTFKREPTEKK